MVVSVDGKPRVVGNRLLVLIDNSVSIAPVGHPEPASAHMTQFKDFKKTLH
jgi:hypothetical protein